MKGVTLLICLVFSTGSFFKPYPKVLTVQVIEIIDGNTVMVQDSLEEKWNIAFSYIDAPEPERRGFEEASDFLKKRVFRKKVKLIINGKDRWGMLRGSIYVHKSSVQEEMIEQGLAWVILPKSSPLLEAEQTARKSRLGIWSNDNSQPPWDWRRNITKQTAKGS